MRSENRTESRQVNWPCGVSFAPPFVAGSNSFLHHRRIHCALRVRERSYPALRTRHFAETSYISALTHVGVIPREQLNTVFCSSTNRSNWALRHSGRVQIVLDAQELAGVRVTLETRLETRTTPGDRSSPYRALPAYASRFALYHSSGVLLCS